MNIIFLALFFLFGLGVGSFINVLVLRLHTGMSFVSDPSQCFSCGARLGPSELVPVLSFLFQWGRCRHCGSKISIQYPVVEAVSGALFALIATTLGERLLSLNTVVFVENVLIFLFFSTLLAMVVYDVRHHILPDSFSAALGIFAILYAISTGTFVVSMLSGIGGFLFFGGLWFVSKGKWMGFGDAKLAFGLGVFLSWPLAFLATLFAFWIGAVWGIVFLLFGQYTRKSQIPFGPFLALGTLLAFFVGSGLFSWYNSIVGIF